ncbi:MAG TPA: helix-turn-helix transcriptional regulator [Candidatus Baltobacteraceae bacterium]|nr:helix-turn-helix transcriptional regulator [Candidatus Baltobacteraceae bacterium]
MPTEVDSLLPLNPRAFYILLSLAEEERHGYAIARAIETITGGTVRLTPGTLYPLIRQLLLDGWIIELGEDAHDPRRRRYRLSALGRRIAQAEARRLDALVRAARSFDLLPASSRA